MQPDDFTWYFGRPTKWRLLRNYSTKI